MLEFSSFSFDSDTVLYAIENGRVIVGVSVPLYRWNGEMTESQRRGIAEEAFIVARDSGQDYFIGDRLAGFSFEDLGSDESNRAEIFYRLER